MSKRSRAGQGQWEREHARSRQPKRAKRGNGGFGPRPLETISEMKYFDSFLDDDTVNISTSWLDTEVDPATLLTLFVPQEGNDINNRVGRKVCVQSLKIRGMIKVAAQPNLTVPPDGRSVRIIVYMDSQTNAAQSQGEQVMAAPGAAVADLTYSTFMNLANLGRFRILKDLWVSIDNPNVSFDGTNLEANGQLRRFKCNIKFRDSITVNFNATNGGTIADIVDNSFHVIAMRTINAPTTTISYQCRVGYKDR